MTPGRTDAPSRPEVVAFDVLGTSFSLERLRPALARVGLPADAVGEWIARTLRDGFGLSAVGDYAAFREVATSALEVLLADRGVEAADEDVEQAVKAFHELDAHADTEEAFRRVHESDALLATVSNGGVDGSRTLLERAGLEDLVDAVHGVDEVHRWKPAADPYLHVARAHEVPPERVALVAVHGWDVMGARSAGLVTGWASRGSRFPSALGRPDVTGETLVDVVDALLALPPAAEHAPSA